MNIINGVDQLVIITAIVYFFWVAWWLTSRSLDSYRRDEPDGDGGDGGDGDEEDRQIFTGMLFNFLVIQAAVVDSQNPFLVNRPIRPKRSIIAYHCVARRTPSYICLY